MIVTFRSAKERINRYFRGANDDYQKHPLFRS
jgi:hypothetical protein